MDEKLIVGISLALFGIVVKFALDFFGDWASIRITSVEAIWSDGAFPPKAKVTFENFGKSPAFKLKFQSRIFFQPFGPDPLSPSLPKPFMQESFHLPALRGSHTQEFRPRYTLEDVQSSRIPRPPDRAAAYFYGIVKYKAWIFPRSVIFCYMVDLRGDYRKETKAKVCEKVTFHKSEKKSKLEQEHEEPLRILR